MGRRTEGKALASAPAMSCPRLPAPKTLGPTLNSRVPFAGPGASKDGEDRISNREGFLAANAVRTICPALGSPISGDRRKSPRRVNLRICVLRHVQQAGLTPADRRQHRG